MSLSIERLDSHISDCLQNRGTALQFTMAETKALCAGIRSVFDSEPSLLELEGPVNICGDIHGQFADLVRGFSMGGAPPENRWLFLGDYVDRGPQSVEVISLLFALKLRYPSDIYLIRGNHETREMTESLGFAEECIKKLDVTAWHEFCAVFKYMPLAAVVNRDYFCVHGGIGPELRFLQQIKDVRRPVSVSGKGLVRDMLWSDPSPETYQYADSTRGLTVVWGEAPAMKFMTENALKIIVRGHQCVDGFRYPFDPNKSVITIFTAANYRPGEINKAAFMSIRPDGTYYMRIISHGLFKVPSGPTTVRPSPRPTMRTASMSAMPRSPRPQMMRRMIGATRTVKKTYRVFDK